MARFVYKNASVAIGNKLENWKGVEGQTKPLKESDSYDVLEKYRLPKATAHEEQRVRWPSKANCPKCWLDGGGWNEEQVYKYLRTHYWRIDPLDSQGTQSKSDLYPLDGQGTQSKSDLYATSIVVPSMKGYVTASWAALCGVIGLFLHFHRRGKKGRSGKCE